MNVEFVYNKTIPLPIEQHIRGLLVDLMWLVPNWAQRVYVEYQAEGTKQGWAISSTIRFEYRSATLTFYPEAIMSGDRQREDCIHDMLHAFLSPLTDYVTSSVERLLEGHEHKAARLLFFEEIRQREEGFIQDLAFVLAAKLYPPNLKRSVGQSE